MGQGNQLNKAADQKSRMSRYGSFGYAVASTRLYLNYALRNGINTVNGQLKPMPDLLVSK